LFLQSTPRRGALYGLFLSTAIFTAGAQQPMSMPESSMPQMSMPQMSMPQMSMPQTSRPQTSMPGMAGGSGMDMSKPPQSLLAEIEHHASSGTSAEPNSTPAPMWMRMHGEWMWMFHGNGFVADEQQSSPRGGDKFFSTNWLMPMAQRPLGLFGKEGQLTVRAMFSLEPATITGERYPLLFQQGETAYGKPIVDGQHPHNFFMEMAALYDWRLGDRTLVSVYAAPVGDPALGPTAYPHRASAAENPVGALGHHQEDSTHIAFDVVTLGVTRGIVRVEGSGFHGREPNEHRWELQQGAVDSWSTRVTVQPGQNWSGQYSYGRLASPEQLSPAENQERMTASVMYNRRLAAGNWASSAVWGRTRSLPGDVKANSYLLESTLQFAHKNYVWTRMEDADRTTELINGEQPLPVGFVEQAAGKVQAYTFGYDRDLPWLTRFAAALGVQATGYGVPSALKPIYEPSGDGAPFGVVVFLRIRPVGRSSK
jgi:hypothetical protein